MFSVESYEEYVYFSWEKNHEVLMNWLFLYAPNAYYIGGWYKQPFWILCYFLTTNIWFNIFIYKYVLSFLTTACILGTRSSLSLSVCFVFVFYFLFFLFGFVFCFVFLTLVVPRKDTNLCVLVITHCLTDDSNGRGYPTIAGPYMVMDCTFRRWSERLQVMLC